MRRAIVRPEVKRLLLEAKVKMTTKTRTTSSSSSSSPSAPARLVASLALFCLLAAIQTRGSAAVVRPTIFSDLNLQEQNSQQQQQQQPQQQQQQQQPLQQQNQAALSDSHSPSTKITPIKSRFCTALNGARLDTALGLQSLAIDDLSLSASSYSNEQVGPHLARLNLDIAGGAWCPLKSMSLSNFGKEWIQVKLNRSYVVSAIETQGRFGMGNGKEFVPSYQVEYSRNGGLSWHKWKDFRGSSLLRANEDTNSVVRNELSPPIVGANVIRILPYSNLIRTVCLRFELHGCPYDEGAPISYSTSDGVVEQRWGHLMDYTYDGLRQHGQLSRGLGQLVDGVKGNDNFSHNNGFEWVGWKSMNGDVVIEFTFKTVRNFTGALFHSNNLFSSGVEVFQAVDVHYGIDVPLSMEALKDSLNERRRRESLLRPKDAAAASGGSDKHQPEASGSEQTTFEGSAAGSAVASETGSSGEHKAGSTLWSSDVLSIEYVTDKKSENSRPVTVHLKQRLANKLRFVLRFASKWILVSEVEFLSHPVELLSLASLSERGTSSLLAALAPARTYDEYVAILREHQLRRLATIAYLESFASSTESTGVADEQQQAYSAPAAPSPPSPGASGNELPSDQPPMVTMQPAAAGSGSSSAQTPYDDYLIPNRQRISGSPTAWQDAPSTNPMLNQLLPPFNMLDSGQHSVRHQQPPIFPHQEADLFGSGPQTKEAAKQRQSSGPTMSLATVIAFALVAILITLAALFALSSYRMRCQQPKLALPRHLAGAKTGGLQGFMSHVFSPHSGNGNGANEAHYNNAIFATGERSRLSGSGQTAKRLARIISPTGSSTMVHSGKISGQQQQYQPSQLLVSLKDSNSVKPSTQLIVGLNQANPLAQQQIYNNSSLAGLHCGSNQTYATHYSTSMASSSTTTGRQGDYADYAIPDNAQPVALGAASHQPNSGQFPLAGAFFGAQGNATHASHHHNHSNGKHLQPFAEQHLRSSYRPSNVGGANQQPSLMQPQIMHQQVGEHNYEPINYQESPSSASFHTRTLSNQLINNNRLQQQHQVPFNSMTLSAARQHNNNLDAKRQQLVAAQTQQECSAGSAATTVTASANSPSSNGPDLPAGIGQQNHHHHYYYATNGAN